MNLEKHIVLALLISFMFQKPVGVERKERYRPFISTGESVLRNQMVESALHICMHM